MKVKAQYQVQTAESFIAMCQATILSDTNKADETNRPTLTGLPGT